MEIYRYKIAGLVLAVADHDGCRSWQSVRKAYEPFVTDDSDHDALVVNVRKGAISTDGLEVVIDPEKLRDNDLPNSLMPYRRAGDDAVYFTVVQPGLDRARIMVRLSGDFKTFDITIDEDDVTDRVQRWMLGASFTTAMQLSYMTGTADAGTLMSHASCVMWQGRAYLFIARSGTGKSTHSRMWLENIPDTVLLNDDHPIVRIVDGVPVAYGSPWSGKTPCYKNLEAPVGAMVRIVRAPENSIHRHSPVAAYASMFSSFSGLTFVESQADLRHRALEQLISAVPCYELHCRPDAEAARVCNDEMKKHL